MLLVPAESVASPVPIVFRWSKQIVLNELVHSHNIWSFASTSENHIISRKEEV